MGYGASDMHDDEGEEVFDDKSYYLGGVKEVLTTNFNTSKLSDAQTLHLR
jgi:hypothetical protein